MNEKTKTELYREFITFIEGDLNRERVFIKKKMQNVFLWCFIFPILAVSFIFIITRFPGVRLQYRGLAEPVLLLFPSLYAVYVIGTELGKDFAELVKKGGISLTLKNNLKRAEWRREFCGKLKVKIAGSRSDWKWLAHSFDIDLKAQKNRTRFLTALSGALFFLTTQAFDAFNDPTSPDPTNGGGLVLQFIATTSTQVSQLVALSLFLLLFYLSGSELQQSLERYHQCLEILEIESEQNEENA